MAVGGSEKWPLQFYPAHLMMRMLGKDGMASAYNGENGGFAGPEVVRDWKISKELCDLAPFQEGFRIAKIGEAASFFHNGKAAFHLRRCLVLTAVECSLLTNRAARCRSVGFFSGGSRWHG
jgi:raffinose/stachyose/melibiose transport system substrate-binding protein